MAKQRGRYEQVADDLNTVRAKKATQIASDISYKGIKRSVDEMETKRNILETEAKQGIFRFIFFYNFFAISTKLNS
jgi:hypothetical protein